MKYKDTVIRNISDYLVWVEDTKSTEAYDDNNSSIILEGDYGYYRGQFCSSWELTPSVLRGPSFLDEYNLLHKSILRLWNEISQFKSFLDKMIYFQHYGLCTRLLDVTYNPLVALYMACSGDSNMSCDGAIYCGHLSEAQNSQLAELTAKYVFENPYQRIILDFQSFVANTGLDINSFTTPIFIQPPINNPRIEVQNGAFIMAPLIDDVLDRDSGIRNVKSLSNTDFFDAKRAIVHGNNKINILHQLSVLGIDRGSIFNTVEDKLRAIVEAEKYKSNLLNLCRK